MNEEIEFVRDYIEKSDTSTLRQWLSRLLRTRSRDEKIKANQQATAYEIGEELNKRINQ